MKARSFKMAVILSLITLIALILLVSSLYYLNSIRSISVENNYNYLSRIRDEKRVLIEGFLKKEALDILNLISVLQEAKFAPNKKVKAILDSQPNINQVVNYDFNFKPLSNISTAGFLDNNEIEEEIRVVLQQNFYFSNYYFRDISLKSGKSILVLFIKDIIGDEYYSLSMDYTFFYQYISEYSGIDIEIYNSKYQVVSSSVREFDPRRVNTNIVTERMKKGFVESVLFNNRYYSYGFIELPGEELYISLNNSKSVVGEKVNPLLRGTVLFFIIFLLITFLVSISLTKYFYNVKEEELLKEIFSDKFTFFHRMKKTIGFIDEKYSEVVKLYKSINYLKNDIDIIRSNLPNSSYGEDKE